MEYPNCYEYDEKVYYELPAKFRWSLTHYDGPMSAIISYQGKNYYGKCHQNVDSRGERYYWLYPLNSVDNFKEKQYQEWFREYIGFHCDYDKNIRRGRSPETWKEKWWELTRRFKKTSQSYWDKRLELKIDRDKYIEREAIGFCTHYTWREHQISLRDRG